MGEFILRSEFHPPIGRWCPTGVKLKEGPMFVVFVITIAVSLRKPLKASRVSHYRKFIRIMP